MAESYGMDFWYQTLSSSSKTTCDFPAHPLIIWKIIQQLLFSHRTINAFLPCRFKNKLSVVRLDSAEVKSITA